MNIGNLTLKSIKHFAQMSEETYCFHANVYWKGKKIGTVKNSGQGGECEGHWDPNKREDWSQMLDWITTLPEKGIEPFSFKENFDTMCNDLVTKFLEEKDFKKMCKKWVYFRGEDYSSYYQIKKSPRYNKEAIMEHLVSAVEEPCTLINDLTFEEYTALVNE